MTKYTAAADLRGAVRAPASKSSMQRATACAALAEGESVLRSPSLAEDSLAALGAAAALGARVERRPARSPGAGGGGSGEIVVISGPLDGGGRLSPRELSCGESGLCLRMFAPIAALLPGETLLMAAGSLRARPVGMMEGVLEPLGASAATRGGFPPVLVRGPLRGGRAVADGSGSSQFVTGLLMALPLAELDSTLEARALASAGYVDLTLDTMRAFGIVVARPPSGAPFEVAGSRRYRPADFEVEGDWSGAAFLLVAGAIASREGIEVSGLPPGSSQPDRAVIGALEAAGALVEMGDSGCRVSRGHPAPFTFDARDCPDLFPPLAVLAAACPGESRIAGVGRLRFKESDRAAAIVGLLGALGTACSLEGDELVVSGGAIGGGRVDPRGDHRIAMAAAVAGLAATGRVEIPGAECVAKSWPGFFGDLAGLLP